MGEVWPGNSDLKIQILRWGGLTMFVRFFRFFDRTERVKLRKILVKILISGRVGRVGLAWKLRPQDLNLEVGGSHNVCSIFHVFFGWTEKI